MIETIVEVVELIEKYGGLTLEAIGLLRKAASGSLTPEEVHAEVERIKRREKEQIDADWQLVKS